MLQSRRESGAGVMRIFLGAILLGLLLAPVEAAPTGPVSVFFDGKWTGEAFADEDRPVLPLRRFRRCADEARAGALRLCRP
jgi:hypothetical protein